MRPFHLPITSFRDALGVAFELREVTGIQTVGLVLTPTKDVAAIKVCGCSDECSLPTCLISVLHQLGEQPFPEATIIFVNATTAPVIPLHEPSIATYHLLTSWCQQLGWQTADWLVTNGEDIRSFAYSLHPKTAWIDDPPADRVADHNMMVIEGTTPWWPDSHADRL